MKRRNFITTATLATAGAVLGPNLFAAHDGKIGKIDPAEWTKINMEAGEKVKAIKPGAEKLSDGDQNLMLEIAAGGMMQLELSKAALAKATSADVKAYAQAEVDEQTGLAAKLKEIAGAKGVTLPEAPDDKTKKAVEKLNAKSGADFDREYLQESGVDGHQALEKTMSKVESKAADATLKTVASTALPLIKTHLQAARDEMKDKG
ncbi:MAG: putative rane protein [Chthoniobacter sp.]|nr:putative rane protein [Chthoniobacter sp.]